MHPVPPDATLTQLKWRYATKKFDPARKIAPELWAGLEQAAVLSPSSYGLQTWKFVVVTDPEVRKKLHPASWNQPQILDASHLVVFAAKNPPTPADVERHVGRTEQVRGLTPGSRLRGAVLAWRSPSPSAPDSNKRSPRRSSRQSQHRYTQCLVIRQSSCRPRSAHIRPSTADRNAPPAR